MDASTILFYVLSFFTLFFAASVILVPNPIYSALFLVLTMVTLAFLFFLLQAYFLAGVQLIVYAGAVLVLFLMVIMLFDLKKEMQAFSKGRAMGFLKIASIGLFCGFMAMLSLTSTDFLISANGEAKAGAAAMTVKDLAIVLFSKYLLAFEVLGILLLLIAVGVVAVSRARGGTHARP